MRTQPQMRPARFRPCHDGLEVTEPEADRWALSPRGASPCLTPAGHGADVSHGRALKVQFSAGGGPGQLTGSTEAPQRTRGH